MNVCTIIAKNYLAHARVLARSLTETNPGSRMWTLVIDDYEGYLDPAHEPFELLTPEQVGCDAFMHMALRYSVLELSTAVKPWLLRHLMGQTGEPITYLDPDIRVYGPLTELDRLAREHGVVLTPHNLRPIPQDGRSPSQVDVMIAGIYNLGYVSLAPGPEVDGLLDWWADRLRRDCRVDPLWGYFVDQRWFDLAPGFMSDLAIVREPQYNVAYWNIHERALTETGDGFAVDGRPLGFFHFSGFDPERPLVLSRHQSRTDVADHPVLERLLAGYASEVLAEGHARSRHWPYGLARLGDGTEPDDELRGLFDEYATEHSDDVASPFTAAGMAAFDRWLGGQAPGAPPGINRAMARVYRDRADVRGAFPHVDGTDAGPFLDWVAGPGATQEPVLARAGSRARYAAVSAATPSGEVPAPQAPLRDGPWGFNVIGDPEDAALARSLIGALDAAAVPAAEVSDGAGAVFSVNLVAVAPDGLRRRLNELGPELTAGRYTVVVSPAEAPAVSAQAAGEIAAVAQELWVAGDAAAVRGPEHLSVRSVDLGDRAAVAQLARRRLDSIEATGRTQRPADPIRERPAALARLPLRIRQGPFPAAAGRGQVTRERLRQTVLRAMKPFTAYQQAVNADVAEALAQLSGEIAAQRGRDDVDRAAAAAARRRDAAQSAALSAAGDRLDEIERLLARIADQLDAGSVSRR